MVLNINKESGWTSFDVVAKIKSLSKIKKVGHAGTLDPLAKGVLVVLTGPDTKKQERIMHSEKEYVCDISFGAWSNTYDLEGEITIERDTPDLENIKNSIESASQAYIGEFEQTVPAFSAVKVKGKKLYNLARKDKMDEIDELPKKSVKVENIEILDVFLKELEIGAQTIQLPTVKLKITCSSGFYVRSLANDLGKDIKTSAVLTDLTRTRVGNYKIEDSVKISELKF